MQGKIETEGSGAVPGCFRHFIFINSQMDIKKITDLIADKKWTAMLAELPEGEHTLPFESVDDIKSCKAIAYSINSDRTGRRYTFNVDKAERTAVVKVEVL